MKLTKVANKAAADATKAMGSKLDSEELEKLTAIIAKAMEKAVTEASKQHEKTCKHFLSHETDLAHQIQQEMERKRIALMANLSSLR